MSCQAVAREKLVLEREMLTQSVCGYHLDETEVLIYMALEFLIPEIKTIFRAESDWKAIRLAQGGIKGLAFEKKSKEVH